MVYIREADRALWKRVCRCFLIVWFVVALGAMVAAIVR